MTTDRTTGIDDRRAVEALRAGVPNRAAIRLLGSSEDVIIARFQDNLRRVHAEGSIAGAVRGQIVAGGFGSGKSHLLGCLQEIALEKGFIVSRVSISKETPLFDAEKLFQSAVRQARIPGHNDDALTAIFSRLEPGRNAYDRLEQWASSREADLAAIFPALLYLVPRQQATPERLGAIERFFAGGKLGTATVKQWLREAGAQKLFPLKTTKSADLIRQRIRFLPRLIEAAGYSGWCILFDEVELVGRYGIVQRARSYAELARWLGLGPAADQGGVVTVAAVTDDFTDRVIGGKRDDELVPPRLLDRGEREGAALAAAAIRAFQSEEGVHLLRMPDDGVLQASLDRTRTLYERAYGWRPPSLGIGARSATQSMRQYIKSWITQWDLQRIYGTTAVIDAGTLDSDYSENTDMEQSAAEDEPDLPI